MAQIRTTHVGSLPRPAQMLAKTLRRQAIDAMELKGYLSDIVARQMSLGLTYINNGELPRPDYVQATVGRIAGFDGSGQAPVPQDLEELPELSRRFSGRNGLITLNPKFPVTLPACSQPLAYTGEASLREELEMMVGVHRELAPAFPLPPERLFFTSPSPGTVALFMENRHHPDYAAYLENIAAVLRQEYTIIAGYGLDLQIDCPDLAMGRHTRFRHLSDEAFLEIMEANIHALNRALEGIDPDRCRVHVCWGNYPGTHHQDIELAKIFDRLTRVRARGISLEASNHRHAHEWELFAERPLPDDKVLLPGVVDTGSNTVEHPDLVAQRIGNYLRLLGPERVIASTDCGFATTASAASIPGEVAWLKLAALVEGARRAGRRWG